MATRRPASRMQQNGSGASRASSRPPSSMSQSIKPPKANTPTAKANNDAAIESNINVIIRVRRRSNHEKAENSPSIVECDSPKGTDVSIQTSAPTSSFGVVSLPPVRTYPFDLVFGPDADQSLIYQDVVSPMLDQVLSGYNCTLFAYGQTGTGKTYTMQGDLIPTPMGNPSAHAGMIPRVLFRMFHSLETSGADYSVKISYIELYNEELRDLLAHEDTGSSADPGLKIFDDAKKGGVIIQGLEEIPVKDSKDALALLQKGSDRRQIASTKFNDHSSRSHSIFSITVHMKEAAAAGEDMLKIGKMNLVDLAGSENIGRSGAENKRAREAGMINQSLLTLGRVITSLVDKAPHIPYRESKLTRLLQDSLGGRTKTSIIATVSPARSNVEETLSTLDYALRAKSITNKPELNARMTRNSLLKEYVAEIERLKGDEHELLQTERDETKKQMTLVESQMRSLRDEYDQCISLLKQRDRELVTTKQQLQSSTQLVEQQALELSRRTTELEEEIVVRQAHHATEMSLDNIAGQLRKVVHQCLKDVEGLFGTLDRQADLLNRRTEQARDWTSSVAKSSSDLTQSLDHFAEASSSKASQLSVQLGNFRQTNTNTLQSRSTEIETRLRNLLTSVEAIQSKDAVESSALERILSVLQDTHTAFTTLISNWSNTLSSTADNTAVEVEHLATAGLAEMRQALINTSTIVDEMVTELNAYAVSVQASSESSRSLTSSHAQQEIARLKEQNVRLEQLVSDERVRGERMRDDVVQRVNGMLSEFLTEKDRRLRESIGYEVAQNVEDVQSLGTLSKAQHDIVEGISSQSVTVQQGAKKRNGEMKRLRNGAVKGMEISQSRLKSGLVEMKNTMSNHIEKGTSHLQSRLLEMQGDCDEAFEEYSKAKRARIDMRDSAFSYMQSDYNVLQDTLTTTRKGIENLSENIASESSSWLALTNDHHAASTSQLKAHPRDSTPRKRAWKYTDQWKLTKNRDVLLTEWRASGENLASSDAPPVQHEPIPINDDPHAGAGYEVGAAMDDDEDGEEILTESGSSGASALPRPRRIRTVSANAKSKAHLDLAALKDSQNVLTTRGSRRPR
ncbi:P-loop containing nucleoside triphosphate hydrolase protein [Flagelloscypha sp. PMI_526]|nr:P-loop containing nucleoside triphosphate hydrolase protein [Flagelloscypha sp. PMI_526]